MVTKEGDACCLAPRIDFRFSRSFTSPCFRGCTDRIIRSGKVLVS